MLRVLLTMLALSAIHLIACNSKPTGVPDDTKSLGLQSYQSEAAPTVVDVRRHWNGYLNSLLNTGFEVKIRMDDAVGKTLFSSEYESHLASENHGIIKGTVGERQIIKAVNPKYRFSASRAIKPEADWVSDDVKLANMDDDFRHDIYDSGFVRVIPAVSDFSLVDLAKQRPNCDFEFSEVSHLQFNDQSCYKVEFVIRYNHDPRHRLVSTAGMNHFVAGRMWLLKDNFLLPIRVEIDHFERNATERPLPTTSQRSELREFVYTSDPVVYPSTVKTSFNPVMDPQYTETVQCVCIADRLVPDEFYLKHYGLPEPISEPSVYSNWGSVVVVATGITLVLISYFASYWIRSNRRPR